MKKMTAFVLALAMSVSVFAGCSSKGNSSAGSSAEGSTSSKVDEVEKVSGKAACVLGVGGLGDQSYNDLVYAGMVKAKEELGVEFDYAEPKQISDFELILRDMSSSGEYEVIVCVGFDQVDPLTKIAPEFPDQKYAIIDGTVEADNVASYACKEEQGSFLVGALAGLMKNNSEAYGLKADNQLGFVGAMEIPLIVKFAAGFEAGVKYVNPEANVAIDYVSGSNPFSDTTTAKEIALSQNSKGADIIYHAAGGSGLGVFQAAKESDFYAIGCNSNQNIIDPDHIVASMLKRVDTAAFEIVKAEVIDNNLQTGGTVILGLEDEGVGYTVEGTNVEISEEDLKVVEEIKEKIKAGEITVPETLEQVDEFLANNKF